ncbi:MAG: hypothetical protein ACI8T1_000199 [Verrucomicrobiales bacterium]|jgi:hypothetical protein
MMNMTWIHPDLIAEVLVRFLWQGALIGAFLALSLACLARASGRTRYWLLCLGMQMMVLAQILTGVRLVADQPIALIAVTPMTSTQALLALLEMESVTTVNSAAAAVPLTVCLWLGGVLLLAVWRL